MKAHAGWRQFLYRPVKKVWIFSWPASSFVGRALGSTACTGLALRGPRSRYPLGEEVDSEEEMVFSRAGLGGRDGCKRAGLSASRNLFRFHIHSGQFGQQCPGF